MQARGSPGLGELHSGKWTAGLFRRSQGPQPGANHARIKYLAVRRASPLVEMQLVPGLPPSLSALRGQTQGCAHGERQEPLFFTASFEEKIFFYKLHEGFFFFLILCTRGYKPKLTVPEKRNKAHTPVPQPCYHSVRPVAAAASPSCGLRPLPAGASQYIKSKCT